MECFIEVDYDPDCVDDVSAIKYCVQGLVPGTDHFPEVATLELCADIETAIRIHHGIMAKLEKCDN